MKKAKDKIRVKNFNTQKGSELMIRKIAWDTFKNTGDINAFLELKQIENLEKQLNNQIDIQEVQKNTNMNLEDSNR